MTSDTGLALHATTRFADCPADLDVLFVPAATARRPGCATPRPGIPPRPGGRARWVTSVCTGSLILGAAGLLEGYRATSTGACATPCCRFWARRRSMSGWCSTATG